MSSQRDLDAIIFGATGFTGKYTIYEGIKLLKGFKWGIAGRNHDKLAKVLREVGEKANKDLSNVPIVIADVGDPESLMTMAKRCKIVINCCGPYLFYGEPVVKACIEAGTHHVDVSGEPHYMEAMQLRYHKQAQERGVYVVSACGFDSIPSDMGTVFLERQFDGTVNSVETFLEISLRYESPTRAAVLHVGTWESGVHGQANGGELRVLRSRLFQPKLPKVQPRLKSRSLISKARFANDRWCLQFPSPDLPVVMRSQHYFYEHEKKRPVQIKSYVTFKTFSSVLKFIVIGAIFTTLGRFKLGRRLLLKHPKFFSLGLVSHEGPPEEVMENMDFSVYLRGVGWSKNEEPSDRPRKEMTAKVSATNPAYGATCVSLVLSATTILKQSASMPSAGGVYPPGAAFCKTTLIEDLCENGYRFEVIEN